MLNVSKFRDLTRFEQSLFGLPILLTVAALCFFKDNIPFSLKPILLSLGAFFSARISGMAFNQYIDREYDARNPRTQNRPIPSGAVLPAQAKWIAWGFFSLFLTFTYKLGTLTFFLSLFAAFLIAIYSYLKRVHALCHFVLGMIHLLAPVLTYTALANRLSLSPFLLGASTFFSIVANEFLYATQDVAFDTQERLHSLPVAIGVKKTVRLAAVFHVMALVMLFFFGLSAHLNWIFYLSIPVLAFVFIRYSRKFKTHPNAILPLNTLFSSILFIFTLASLL